MKKIFLSTFILLVIPKMYAQQVPSTLVQLVRTALDYAPKIKEQQQVLVIGGYKTDIQKAQLKPVVQGDASITRFDPVAKATLGGTTIQFQPNMNYNAGVGIYHTLYDWGRQQIQVDKSIAENKLVLTGIEGMKNGIAYQITSLYYGIIYLNKAIEVQKEQLTLIENNTTIIADKLKKGDELEYNKVAMNVRYKNAEIRLGDLQSQVERQYIVLGSLIGKDAHGQIPADATFQIGLPSLTSMSALDAAQSNNTDLQLLKEKDALADFDIKTANLATKPTLTANAIAGIKNGYVPRINGEQPAFTDDFKLNTMLGVKLSVPIYSGNRGAYGIQMAKVSKELLKYSEENTQQSLKRDLTLAENDYKAAQNKYALSEKNIYQAEYALKLAQVRYKGGVITSLDIEAAENALQEALLNRLQYQYLMTLAQMDLHRISGVQFW